MHLFVLVIASLLALVTSFSLPHQPRFLNSLINLYLWLISISLFRSGQFSARRRAPCRALAVPSSTAARTLLSLIPAATITSVLGGILSGGLHAVSGPDHLAAVLPRCLGKRWWVSCRIGAVWALGHGVSASLLGIFAFFLKGKIELQCMIFSKHFHS